MKGGCSIAALMACVISCCAPKADPQEESAPMGFLQRLDQSQGYVQDENGNWAPKVDKRSSFESKGKSAYFDGKVAGKSFNTERYAKKSWWGSKEMPRKPYSGKMESVERQTSNFDGRSSDLDSAAYRTSSYDRTGSYATHSSHEDAAADLEKTSDAETDIRRRTYIQPPITDYEQQRGLSIEQSKSLLGN